VFSWIYDVPPLLAIVAFGVAFVGIFWLGILVLRPLVRKWLHREEGLNATLGDYLQYFGVIYGLLLGLLAVGAYQNHADAEKSVVTEAAGLAALYRDVSGYPEPYRTDLRTLVREYARSTIEDAWPQQRRGILPLPEAAAASPVVAIYGRMSQFEPATKGQEAIHETALRQFDTFLESRRERLYSVTSGMPRVMWYTVALGALVNMIFLWLFDLRIGTHLLLGALVSFFTATMICLIAILDRPFKGEIGVSPEAFQLVYQQMMQD
jgi:hypothetical protein